MSLRTRITSGRRSAGAVAESVPTAGSDDVGSAPVRAAKAPPTYGIVEVFGRREIVGWVAVKKDAPPVRISLRANKTEVTGTWAVDRVDLDNWGEVRSFRLALHDIWSYCRRGDRLSVRADGRVLPIYQRGMLHRVGSDGSSTLAALQAKLDEGFVFGQGGRLQLSKTKDLAWQTAVMGLYARVRTVVRRETGQDAFFCYGTLLGAIRDHGFIGHDLDFDSAYVSTKTSGADAGAELAEIAAALIADGLHVDCRRTALHIHDRADGATRIDLFHLYFDDTGKLAFPFGVAGTTSFTRADWSGTREIELGTGRGLVPANGEAFVERIYGQHWRIPKPGFTWDRDRTDRDRLGILPLTTCQSVYWRNFYAHESVDTPSSLHAFVAARADLPGAVIDLGAGDGRDSLAFAAAGRTVVALDNCAAALARIERADPQPAGGRVSVRRVDVADAAALSEALASARADTGSAPVLFYLRWLLHAISEPAQQVVLGEIVRAARPGDLLVAEFRDLQDAALPKHFGTAYRRFQDGAAFATSLDQDYGFTVVEQAAGTGLSPLGREDPFLQRVLAHFDGR